MRRKGTLFGFVVAVVLFIMMGATAQAVPPQIAAGVLTSYAILSDGTLYTWGYDGNGRLGNGSSVGNQPTPYSIATGSYFTATAAAHSHGLAVDTDGKLYAWGSDSWGVLGNGPVTGDQQSPYSIATGSTFRSVAAAIYHSAAIDTDGKLYTWGYDGNGRLGNGPSVGDQDSPYLIATSSTFTVVAAGNAHTAAIDTDGKLYTWGSDANGKLGNGQLGDQDSPYSIATGSTFRVVATGGEHTAAIDTDGKLYTWGNDSSGQLGNGPSVSAQQSPYSIATGSTFIAVAAGTYHTAAIDADGKLYTWGKDTSGQLGNGPDITIDQQSPVHIAVGSTFIAVAAGDNHTMAIDTNGTLWAWGDNANGKLGVGDSNNRNVPTSVMPVGPFPVTTNAGAGGSINPIEQLVDIFSSATFTVSPDTGYNIDTVTGCGGSLNGNLYSTATITSGPCTVSATFVPVPTLNVSVSGSGTVTSSPSGINCGNTCSAVFSQGTVTLTATSDGPSYLFTGWTGDCSGTGTCQVTMNTSKSVTAAFSEVTIAASPASPQVIGTSVTFTAAVNGGSGTYEYQFQRKAPDDTSYTVVQEYSTTNTLAWNTTGAASGVYTIRVLVRNAGSTAAYEAYRSLSYSLVEAPPVTAVTLTSDLASPQMIGTTVTFTAAASGGSGTYEYQFQRKAPGETNYTVVQEYSTTDTLAWNTTGAASGIYTIRVLARNVGSTAGYEAFESLSYSLVEDPPATAVTLITDLPSPQVVGTTVIFTAAASGGSGTYEYKFLRKAPGETSYTVVQDYSATDTLSWNTTGSATGTYNVTVYARNAGSAAAYEAQKKINYVLN